MRTAALLTVSAFALTASAALADPAITVYTTDSSTQLVASTPSFSAYAGQQHRLIDLDAAQPEQTIDGFGGAFNERGWEAMSALKPEVRQGILNDLFSSDGLGLTIGRMPIGASDYAMDWYSYDETPGDYALKDFSIARDRKYLLPYLKSALAIQPNLTIFASPWSPPSWMKANNHYACQGMRDDAHLIWDERNEKAYAQYFIKYVEAYAAEGVTIAQIDMQNEPAACQNMPSSLWTGVQMRDFLRDDLVPAFDKAKLPTQLWLGTINHGDVEDYAEPVLDDPILAKRITGVAYQWDGKYAIAETHKRWPNIKLMQSENECGDGKNTLEYGFYVLGLMQTYFEGGARAYVYWNMVLDATGMSTWGWPQNAMISVDRGDLSVHHNFEYYVMKHVAHFVKPGAVFLNTGAQQDVIAFKNPDGTDVVVMGNPSWSDRHVTLKVDGKALDYTLKFRTLYTAVIKP